MNTQKGFSAIIVLVGLLILGLLGTAGWLFISNDTPRSAATSQQDDVAAKSSLKSERHYGIHGQLTAYKTVTGSYLAPTMAAWTSFAAQSSKPDSLTDPFTDTGYTFTDKDPEYGEIQYRYPASCDDARAQFVAANTAQSYAFRLKFPDGIRCSHSL